VIGDLCVGLVVILSSVAGQAVPEDVDQVVGSCMHNLATLLRSRTSQHVRHVKANPFRSMLCQAVPGICFDISSHRVVLHLNLGSKRELTVQLHECHQPHLSDKRWCSEVFCQ